MKLVRYIGDIVKMERPSSDAIKVLWITREYDACSDDMTTKYTHVGSYRPSMWFIYNDDLYVSICDYEFDTFETYDDILLDTGECFNEWTPSNKEVDFILDKNPIYILANPIKILESDLDEYCEFELEFIREQAKIINRNNKIDDVTNA